MANQFYYDIKTYGRCTTFIAKDKLGNVETCRAYKIKRYSEKEIVELIASLYKVNPNRAKQLLEGFDDYEANVGQAMQDYVYLHYMLDNFEIYDTFYKSIYDSQAVIEIMSYANDIEIKLGNQKVINYEAIVSFGYRDLRQAQK